MGSRFYLQGWGFRFGLRVLPAGFRIKDRGLSVQDLGFRMYGKEEESSASSLLQGGRVEGFELMVRRLGLGFAHLQGVGCSVVDRFFGREVGFKVLSLW